jgi:muramoyltetrapeptide carboxypeptidase
LGDVLEEAAKAAAVPTISGIPLGHITDQWSIPLGMNAELDADAKRLTVIY